MIAWPCYVVDLKRDSTKLKKWSKQNVVILYSEKLLSLIKSIIWTYLRNRGLSLLWKGWRERTSKFSWIHCCNRKNYFGNKDLRFHDYKKMTETQNSFTFQPAIILGRIRYLSYSMKIIFFISNRACIKLFFLITILCWELKKITWLT